MGVSQRNVWVLAVACGMGCQQAGDTVLQPDVVTATGTAGAMNTPVSGRGDLPASTGVAGVGSSPGRGAAANGGGVVGAAGGASVGVAGAGVGAGVAGTAAVGGGSAGSSVAGVGAAGMSSGAAGEPVATMAGAGPGASGAGGSTEMMGAADPDCDFNGIWIAKQMTVSEALSLPQTSNNWYYLELKQTGTAVEVTKHFDCGIEVQGSATVTTSRATIVGSLPHNIQTGRKITVMKQGASCSLDAARFWSIRGADETRFLPNETRDSADSVSQVSKTKPLPTTGMPDGAVDIEDDGKPGIAFQLTGVISGTRNSVQRDWSRWFTEPGYEIAASTNWTSDLKIRADFDNEESVLDPTSGLLVSTSAPKAGAKHAIELRFLGRDASDPRVSAVVKGSDIDTCYAIQDALPAGTLE